LFTSNYFFYTHDTELTDSERKKHVIENMCSSPLTFDPLSKYRVTVSISNRWVRSLATSVVISLRNILYVTGYQTRSSSRELTSIQHVLSLFLNDTEKEALDRAKFLTASFICDVTHHERPERPECVVENESLFAGEWRRFIMCRIPRNGSKPSSKIMYIAGSILQLKRFFPELPKSMMAASAKKHHERLSKKSETELPFLNAIRWAVNALFPVGWDEREYSIEPEYVLSNKSCFEKTRKEGGNLSAGLEKIEEFFLGSNSRVVTETIREPLVVDDFSFEDEEINQLLKDIDRYEEHTCVKNRISESNELVSMLNPRDGNVFEIFASVPEITDRESRNSLFSYYSDKDFGHSSVAFVADPAKWRTVTKSNWSYSWLKPYQLAIHGHLRQFDQFRLIGKTISEQDLEFFSTMTDSESALSGDYEAATDNIFHDSSVTCLALILDNMTSKWASDPRRRNFAKGSMEHLNIHYPKELTDMLPDLPEVFLQEGGQLMGSLLSFPVLCVINYAMWGEYCSRTYGYYPSPTRNNQWSKKDFVLINGDDIAGIVKDGTERVWQNVVRSVGLTPSLGKNYVSKLFLTINSQMYLLKGNSTEYKIENVPWVNQALLRSIGSTKSTKDLREKFLESDESPLTSLGKMHDDFVRQCPYEPGRGSSCFIHFHRKELSTTFRNLFGPIHLGGLGATPVPGEKGSVLEGYNDRQMVIATLLYSLDISLPSYAKKQGIKDEASTFAQIGFSDRIKVLLGFESPKQYETIIGDDGDCERRLRVINTHEDISCYVPAGLEDITDIIKSLEQKFLTLLSWIRPFELTSPSGTDWSYFRQILKKFSGKYIRSMDLMDYLSESPKEVRYLIARDKLYNKRFGIFDSETDLNGYLLDFERESSCYQNFPNYDISCLFSLHETEVDNLDWSS
jgi:hypothetical protein